jgi:hypothetical protein
MDRYVAIKLILKAIIDLEKTRTAIRYLSLRAA